MGKYFSLFLHLEFRFWENVQYDEHLMMLVLRHILLNSNNLFWNISVHIPSELTRGKMCIFIWLTFLQMYSYSCCFEVRLQLTVSFIIDLSDDHYLTSSFSL